ncbi:MAG TPA: aspartate kinase, partial [Candidatus Thermoplasmatota archaeon]|nr:aspartate kinase [Candidatus Thermoplasmatota archaeon]
DLAASFGERLSVRLLAAACREAGVRAAPLDAEAAGVLTDGVFGGATPDLAATEKRFATEIAPRVETGDVPILTGYYGVDAQGHVTTFGRGGSDYSAAIAAYALPARRLEVWKDVDGYLTADPRICPDARPIVEMSYDEAAELSYLGGEILHPRTVEPVARKGIPIVVKNTNRPEPDGTIIEAPRPEHSREFRGVAVKDGLAILKLSGPGMAYTPGIGRRVFTALGDAGVNVYNMAASQASFALLVNGADLETGLAALAGVDGVVRGVETIRDRTLVCFVGQAIGSTPGVAGKIFSTVGRAGVNVEMIMVGASDMALNFVVPTTQRTQAVRALHAEFLAGEAKRA